MTTNVPPVEFTPAGLVVPQESAVLSGVQADYNEAFGGNLNPGLATPQGQLASSTTAVIADNNSRWAWLVNQIDPDYAEGFMQDAIGRIYFLDRSPGAPTAVQCVCMGAFGTVIPVGAEAQDTSGNRYICTQAGTIPVSGTITLSFANIVDGPVPCPADTLTIIYRSIPGWDSINNPTDGVPGRLVESRAEFEFRRRNSVALNAHGSKEAIYANVFDVEDVIDVFVTENVTDDPLPFGATNYPLLPHSVFVSVVGGAAQDVGEAIYVKKDLGCNMNGNTTVTVYDNNYVPPVPYTITFLRPDALPILFEVRLKQSPQLPSNISDLVKSAIVASFNGADGSARVRIGDTILASKFYGPVSAIGPGILILSIKIALAGPVIDLDSIATGIDQAPTVSNDDITVTIVP